MGSCSDASQHRRLDRLDGRALLRKRNRIGHPPLPQLRRGPVPCLKRIGRRGDGGPRLGAWQAQPSLNSQMQPQGAAGATFLLTDSPNRADSFSGCTRVLLSRCRPSRLHLASKTSREVAPSWAHGNTRTVPTEISSQTFLSMCELEIDKAVRPA